VVEVLDAKTREQLCFLDKVEPHSTIGDIKSLFYKLYPRWYPARQSLTLDPKGKFLRDEEILQSLPVGTTATMYFKDLGPQLGWTTVFFAENIGPLLIYLLFYFRVPYIYSDRCAFTSSPHKVVTMACVCHTFHYLKRLIETIFVHRFSHGSMPLRTIVKNCLYYWGFSAWLAYYINHPLYTPPSYGEVQVHYAMVIFAICEMGNFSIHLTYLPAHALIRFPVPSKNPFTWLFFFVSCPNHTYEVGTWVSFSIMTQCLPVAVFTVLGFIQMTVWAKGKHRAYVREFKDYPAVRVAIIPLIL
uniref:Very-long-chain enoyl-CoA reductase n=1 Tax=Oryzias sinensis TaxID=183150 RepID=A0A8C7ZB00_9TELE